MDHHTSLSEYLSQYWSIAQGLFVKRQRTRIRKRTIATRWAEIINVKEYFSIEVCTRKEQHPLKKGALLRLKRLAHASCEAAEVRVHEKMLNIFILSLVHYVKYSIMTILTFRMRVVGTIQRFLL
uniref:C-type lectin domain-containing protein n=1 Tax=Parascaris univalens TaxID=6257 RepID=A0A915BMB1_PARUN